MGIRKMTALEFKPVDVLNALRAGKARDFTKQDFEAFSGAPAGSCIVDGFGDDVLVIVGAGFQVEVHGVDAEGDCFAFVAHADGHWVEA